MNNDELTNTEHAGKSVIPEIEWNWNDANYFADWHEPIYELLARYVPQGSRILEVGAGGSHTLGALAGRLRCEAVGIEPDRAGIAKASELAQGESAEVRMVQGDGFYLPFADGEFDVVYSLGLVEHFTLRESERLVAEHVRVCRNDGIVIVAVPNTLNLPHTLRKAYLGSGYEFSPERSYTPSQLNRLTARARLRLVAMDGVAPLWGLGMNPLGWRIVTIMRRLGLARKLNEMRRPSWRAVAGFMTYAIGKKQK